jgi:hypothetical protein
MLFERVKTALRMRAMHVRLKVEPIPHSDRPFIVGPYGTTCVTQASGVCVLAVDIWPSHIPCLVCCGCTHNILSLRRGKLSQFWHSRLRC